MNYTENPPAFPISHNGSTLPGMHGLTMRDYFAAMVIVNVLPLSSANAFAAKEAYKIADEMMKAR